MRQLMVSGAVGALSRLLERLPALAALPAALLIAFAPAPLRAQPFPEIGSSTWLTWEAYGQDACLARAAQTMIAARAAFGLRDLRPAGAAGLAEAIDTGDTHAMIACAADFETRLQRSLVIISAHTSRLGLEGPLRDFLVACMTTPRCSPQPIAGVAGVPGPAQLRPPVGQPGQAASPPMAMPTTPGAAMPGRLAQPGGPPRVAVPMAPGTAMPGTIGQPASPPRVAVPGGPRVAAPTAIPGPGPAGVPRAISGGPVASLGNVPPPGPPESANLRWPRPDPRRLAARQPQQPPAPAATAAGPISAFCGITRGPRAGQVLDYSRYPGVTGAPLGSYCSDSMGSEGVIVAPTATAVAISPIGTPAQGMPLPGGAAPALSYACGFNQGPLAGRVVDYSRTAGATAGPIGSPCGDGGGSSGVIVPPNTAATPLPTQPPPFQQAAPAYNVSGSWISSSGDRFEVVQTSPTSFTWSSSTRGQSGGGGLRGQTVEASWGTNRSLTATITQVDQSGRATRIEGSGLVLTRPSMATCTLPGRWRNVITGLGESTWDIDAGGVARETGLASVTLQAGLADNQLTIQGQNGGTGIYYSVTLGQDCSGAGQLTLTDGQGRRTTYPVQFTLLAGGQSAAPSAAAPQAPANPLRYLAVRFGELRTAMTVENYARLYSDLSLLLANYGATIGWVNGGDTRARAGDPNRGLLNAQAHYDYIINGGGPAAAGYIEGRLEDLARDLPSQSTAAMARQAEALLGGRGQ